MEHAIGTRITLKDGRKAEVVEGPKQGCGECIFRKIPKCPYVKGVWMCRGLLDERTDGKNIIYKEVKEETK